MAIRRLTSLKYSHSLRFSIIILLLIAGPAFVYWHVTSFDFINFDDDKYILENIYVNKGITFNNIIQAFSISKNSIEYWLPLTWISHMLDCQLFGLDPGMHHLMNVIIHVLNTILLFIVFYYMTGGL